MTLALISIDYLRKNNYALVYTATCDCGCKSTRHIAVYKNKKEPTQEEAIKAIHEDYDKK